MGILKFLLGIPEGDCPKCKKGNLIYESFTQERTNNSWRTFGVPDVTGSNITCSKCDYSDTYFDRGAGDNS